MHYPILPKKWLVGGTVFVVLVLSWQVVSGMLVKKLEASYESLQSQTIYDRQGVVLQMQANQKGYYDEFISAPPDNFKNLLLKKEDRFFYWHPGINAGSLTRDFFSWLIRGKRQGSSTLTQQLVKTLLANENDRSLKNKLEEILYTFALEWRENKNTILTMYVNSAYFGSSTQGLHEASEYYFQRPPETLSDAQMLSLLASLNSPSISVPSSPQNVKAAKALAQNLKVNAPDEDWQSVSEAKPDASHRSALESFELSTLDLHCQTNCQLTIDSGLSDSIREILKRNLLRPELDTATNGAVVVIKLPENELLSMVGSPDPSSQGAGMQLNMATKPRPIGSTAKPFIYLNAFEKGARPYTLVNDEEIKYQIGTGFDFYPKNFDGQYRGIVTLHQALDNSLNVPSVQVLQYVGLDNFYNYLQKDLGFRPLQPLQNYELGIALGGLESDLTTLSYYFTQFPQQGVLKPLTLYKSGYNGSLYYPAPMAEPIVSEKQVGQEAYVELVNRILNDRDTGVDQFGIKSNLNLPFTNYALKTGTSRDYHDSWTVGYTPDFLVGVWVGNSNNLPMKQITGLAGAAKIWREVMLLMYNSNYNKNAKFDFSKVKELQVGNTLDFGLAGDNVEAAQNVMLSLNDSLISSPHDQDKFLLQSGTAIPLSATTGVTWTINGKIFDTGANVSWHPTATGTYTIEAKSSDGKSEQVTVYLNKGN